VVHHRLFVGQSSGHATKGRSYPCRPFEAAARVVHEEYEEPISRHSSPPSRVVPAKHPRKASVRELLAEQVAVALVLNRTTRTITETIIQLNTSYVYLPSPTFSNPSRRRLEKAGRVEKVEKVRKDAGKSRLQPRELTRRNTSQLNLAQG